MAEDVLTPEFAQKVASSLNCTPSEAQGFARRLREHGIGLVDIERARCWIDERVYSGVQFRLRQASDEIEGLRSRITGLEAMLCDAQAEVERLRGAS